LPIGVQIIADYGDDATALAGARFLEHALRS
jgi:Asp-tRNA(Asn)/Glu-tRNA(Gln) amidotransferase A subunit family amidase